MIFEDDVALAFRDISPQVLNFSRIATEVAFVSGLIPRPTNWQPS